MQDMVRWLPGRFCIMAGRWMMRWTTVTRLQIRNGYGSGFYWVTLGGLIRHLVMTS